MRLQRLLDGFFLVCMIATVVTGAVGCSSSTPSTTATTPVGPGAGEVINGDSIITATIKAIRGQTTGYPWEVDIFVNTTKNVGDLPNPTKDSVGKVITVKTDENMSYYKPGDEINARVKYTGDVPKPGITLYLYSVAR